ncbi:hypothetical protein CHS0354_000383 [Potamilus streckersoni]|uniref:Alpha N-terminal protein methyltransferase 1 n=1 Tax=Potamilus streckersoni TaxID=2493646 RepID=A0AAE0SMA5_9BIVA|nr:hypothetical protein CHS0354_000383 [Potamilus streckersoni]
MADEEQNSTCDFYGDAKKYWDSIPANLDGMLGGFAQISPTDIDGSKAFIRPLLTVGGGKTKNIHALDCGAGIGRITKRLLLPTFKYVDMVELSQHFLDAAGQFIGSDISRVERRICCGLQDFNPERGRYDVIWCQWVLGHLRDDDLVDFFRRCKTGLTPEGIIVIKENFTSADSKDFDSDDSSYTRPRELLIELINKSGLKILKQQKQKGFPKGLYDVYMFAVQ